MRMKRLILLTVLSLTIFKFTNGQELENNSDSIKKTQHLKQKEECQIITTKLNTGDRENEKLIAILDSIYQEDQKYRLELMEILNKSDRNESDNFEIIVLSKIIKERDSINIIKIEMILNEHGWLGADVIGEHGNNTLFLVIQHSNLETQLKYLPMMQEAVKLGNLKSNDFAILEDRIAVRQGKRQIYGSQIFKNYDTGESYVYPLIEPEKVNERRAKVGLDESIEDYVKRAVGLTWDVEKHKESTKKIESQKE
jgi:hypothetical protein